MPIPPSSRTFLLAALGAVTLGAALAGCDDARPFDVNLGNPVEARITSDTTGLSPAAPGAQVRVAVRLTGADRQPVADWAVVWTPQSSSVVVGAPQGAVSSDTTRTDADGVAETMWTLGEGPATYSLDVRAANVVRSQGGDVSPRPGPDLAVTVR